MATTLPTSVSRPILGPLSKTFILPSSCWPNFLTCPTCSYGWLAQACSSGTPYDDTNCWPSATSYPVTSPPLAGLGFYSPGLQCPQYYYGACFSTYGVTQSDAFNFQFKLTATETGWGCCPSGFVCTTVDGYGWQTCQKDIDTSDIAIASCVSGSSSLSTVTIPFTTGSDDTIVSKLKLLAPLVMVVWQETDVFYMTTPPLTASPTASSAQPSSTAQQSLTTHRDASGSAVSAVSGGGLSNGAVAGIAVGSVLGFLALVFALVFFCFRKRYQLSRRGRDMSAPASVQGRKVMNGSGPPGSHVPVQELETRERPGELDSQGRFWRR
ncbi:hypothetical protein EJ04DRAFT_596183 [Polyplosphaeria fusca]|uniref:Uncharacterized protein n=1 Tax=Polyplosphaeria fusca TaxID=682080 RepID=A0A9P4UUD8_9PLEO|nr:hypothetical protein EJ04DRAFT_596183 [Polyplosphaeria fusca]